MTNSLISGIDAGIACGAHVGKAEIFSTLHDRKEGFKQGDIRWSLVNDSDSSGTVVQVIKDTLVIDAKGVLC